MAMTHTQTVGGMRKRSWRLLRHGALLAALALFALIGATGTAQEANIALDLSPEQPSLSAGESLQFSLEARNVDTGTTWDATDYASFSVTDPTGTITRGLYQARSAGTWTITADYSDRSVSTQVVVNPGPVQHIVVDPNSYPERITTGDKRQFTARAYDAWNNQIPNPDLSWSLNGNIGTLNANGILETSGAGEANIVVRAGNVSSQVSVVVQAPRPVNTNTANTNLNSGNTNTVNEEEPTNTNGDVLGNANANTNGEAMTDDEETSAASCWNIHWWGWFLIMLAYFALLYGFFYVVRGTDDRWIWLGPLVLTAIALAIFFAFRCDAIAGWYPWLTVIGGLLITLFRPLKFIPKNGDSL